MSAVRRDGSVTDEYLVCLVRGEVKRFIGMSVDAEVSNEFVIEAVEVMRSLAQNWREVSSDVDRRLRQARAGRKGDS